MMSFKNGVIAAMTIFTAISSFAQNAQVPGATRPKGVAPRQQQLQPPPPLGQPRQGGTQRPAQKPRDSFRTSAPRSNVVRSEMHYQPGAHRSAVTAGFNYNTLATQYGSAAGILIANVTRTESVFNAQYEYGITSNYSLGIAFNYGSADMKFVYDPAYQRADDAFKFSGMGDIALLFKGLYPLSNASIIYGLNPAYSGQKTLPSATVTGTRNTGGLNFEAFGGAQFRLAPTHTLGARLNYLYITSHTIKIPIGTTTTIDATESGGSKFEFIGFYEKEFSGFTLDGGLGYRSEAATVVTDANAVATTTAGKGSILFNLDGTFIISKSFQLGVFYHGASVSGYVDGVAQYGSYLQHQAGLFGRFNF